MNIRSNTRPINPVNPFIPVSLFVVFFVMLISTLAYSADRLVVQNTEGETKFVVTQDGKVGIGTSNPGQDLDIVAPNNGLLRLSNTTTDNTPKASRIVLRHYSNGQLPVYFFGAASTATDNFIAFGGGNTIGNAATQIDLFTASNTTTPVGYPRVTIIGNGYVGIGIQDPLYPLEMASGAYVTTGGVWTNASSREYKDNIKGLKIEDAIDTLQGLNPVTFSYKLSSEENHVGFVAEDVPELIATKDRKGLSPMDIVAVLTKVVQEQQKTISALNEKMIKLENALKSEGSLVTINDSIEEVLR
jgi:hypothetical protein